MLPNQKTNQRTVVVNRLVSSDDDRVTLRREDVEAVNRQRVGFNTISLDNSHIVVVDRDGVRWATAEVDEAETIALALSYICDRKRYSGPSRDTAGSVNCGRILNSGLIQVSKEAPATEARRGHSRVGTTRIRKSQELGSREVVPVTETEDGSLCRKPSYQNNLSSKHVSSLTIIDVVHIRKRVFRVVNDEWAAKTVTVLRRQVRVVPIGSRLAGNTKVVKEGIAGNDGALGTGSESVLAS